MKRYLRVGELPEGGRSWNFALGGYEFGVSVYDLDADDRPVVPPEDEYGESSLRMRLESGDPLYVVTGDEAGVGHDGEPLLANVRILEPWSVKTLDGSGG